MKKKCDFPRCTERATVFCKKGSFCMKHVPALGNGEEITAEWQGIIPGEVIERFAGNERG